jgi:hypothetical protein
MVKSNPSSTAQQPSRSSSSSFPSTGALWNVAAECFSLKSIKSQQKNNSNNSIRRRTLSRVQSLTALYKESTTVQAQYLILSILSNDPFKVEDILVETDLCPTFTLTWGTSPRRKGRSPDSLPAVQTTIDQIFLLKSVLGDNPTPLHISVLQVYNQAVRCSNTVLKGRKDLVRSIKICQLLIQHDADIGFVSTYCCATTGLSGNCEGTDQKQKRRNCFYKHARQLSALDWAFGLRHLAMHQSMPIVEHAIQIILDEMLQRLHDDEDNERRLQLAQHDFIDNEDEYCWGQDIVVDENPMDTMITQHKQESEGMMSYDRSIDQMESRDDDHGSPSRSGDENDEQITNSRSNEQLFREDIPWSAERNRIHRGNDQQQHHKMTETSLSSPSLSTLSTSALIFGSETISLLDSVMSFLFGGSGSSTMNDWRRHDYYDDDDDDDRRSSYPSPNWHSTKHNIDLKIFVIEMDDDEEYHQLAPSSSALQDEERNQQPVEEEVEPEDHRSTSKPSTSKSTRISSDKFASVVRI